MIYPTLAPGGWVRSPLEIIFCEIRNYAASDLNQSNISEVKSLKNTLSKHSQDPDKLKEEVFNDLNELLSPIVPAIAISVKLEFSNENSYIVVASISNVKLDNKIISPINMRVVLDHTLRVSHVEFS